MKTEKDEVTCFTLENRLKERLDSLDEDYDLKDKAKRRGVSYDDARQDAITEVIDGIVPIYNYDLLTVAGSNLWLGEHETQQDNKTAFACLREAIFDHLLEKAGELEAERN